METKSSETCVSLVEELHSIIQERPHCPLLRLQLASQYDFLDYPDLASAEAYNALLIGDEVSDEDGEWHDDAVENLHETLKREAGLDLEDEDLEILSEWILKAAYVLYLYLSLSGLWCFTQWIQSIH